jgi:HK97 family phage major capsid protein
MTFKTVAEAFNHYRKASEEDIEKRAADIKKLVDSDPDADIAALNIELDGLSQAKQNLEERNAAASKLKAFNPVTGAGFHAAPQTPVGDVFASREYRSAFFKHLLGRELDAPEKAAFNKAVEKSRIEARADSFSTSTNTAAVLPTATLNEIISKARTIGGLIAACRNFAMPSNIAVPVATPTSAAAWHAEGAQAETTNPDITTVTFSGNEIIKIFSVSTKVQSMSIPAFESYLEQELTASVMDTIAQSLVNGTGEAQGTGVLSLKFDGTDGSQGLTFADGGSDFYDQLLNAIATLKRGYNNGAAFAMNNATLYKQVYGLKDGNGRPLFVNDPTAGGNGYVLGKPVIVDDYLPDDVILFGNFQYLGYNLPAGIMVEVSRESSFRSALIDYRALAIADTKPIVPEAFVKLSKATA